MSSDEYKALVLRYLDQIQTKHNLDVLDQFLSAGITDHTAPPGAPKGIDASRQFFKALFRAFPDMRPVVHDQAVEGNKVWTYKTMKGTHLGEYMGIAPTGKTIEYAVIDIVRIQAGRITDHWAVGDRLSLMKQLGLVS
ncbi:MAG: ester cyclase [Chloroflexi bacterium]|nr:ester cyclase [Chloroflexota bacterium]